MIDHKAAIMIDTLPHPAWIEINLTQFQQNLRFVRQKIGNVRFCLCVKANAYGHGLLEIAKAAETSSLVDYLGVACLKEGIFLRSQGIVMPIFVFGAIDIEQIHGLIQWELEFTISSKLKADLVIHACKTLNKTCRVHLEVDTGMRRTGVRPETAFELIPWLSASPYLDLVGVYSHFATSDLPNDPFAQKQIVSFTKLKNSTARKDLIWHLANSGGVLFYPDSYLDMVRPGILCYGYSPSGEPLAEEGIAPCYAVKAKISYFKVVAAGDGISYGHEYHPTEQSRIVTIPLGYGDGLRRVYSQQGSVLIRGKKYPIAGRICMDQFMVDIGQDSAYVGDEVTIIGTQDKNAISLEEAALHMNTISYELLCAFNGRLSRVYSNDAKTSSED